ncbi:MAG: hypothetical protein WBQ34_09445 [Candidatus Acidiferrales bacterium]
MKAKSPEGVLDKMRECSYFLDEMSRYEKAVIADKFGYCLSAFLNSFRTVTFRLAGVVENISGKATSENLLRQLKAHREIGFLMARRDVEVHEDGAVIFERFTVHVVPREMNPSGGRFSTRLFTSRFQPRFNHGIEIRHVGGWQFTENPMSITELCRDALEKLEPLVRNAITSGNIAVAQPQP